MRLGFPEQSGLYLGHLNSYYAMRQQSQVSPVDIHTATMRLNAQRTAMPPAQAPDTLRASCVAACATQTTTNSNTCTMLCGMDGPSYQSSAPAAPQQSALQQRTALAMRNADAGGMFREPRYQATGVGTSWPYPALVQRRTAVVPGGV